MSIATPRDYTLIAPYYDKVFNRFLSEGHQKIGLLLKNKKMVKGVKVLEIGVGSGLLLHKIPNSVEYTGIDINEKMLDLAKTKASGIKRKKITLTLMDAQKLNFKANAFDFVMAASVISAVENPNVAIKEMIRVTKKGGHIAIIANFRHKTSRTSKLIHRLDPLTKRYLGFRTDLDGSIFEKHKGLRLVENQEINSFLGISLSSFLVFEKI